MKVGNFYVGKSGEAVRIIEMDESQVYACVFESRFVMKGPIENFAKLEMTQIQEPEYKARVVAMHIFQLQKTNQSVFNDYLTFYEQLKDKDEEFINKEFEYFGGFNDYETESDSE